MNKSNVLKFIVFLVACYIVFCLCVYLKPQWFFYNPTTTASNLKTARVKGYPATKVEYKATDGQELYAWFTKPQTKGQVIVFMHGNSYNIEKFYYKMLPLIKAGYGTMMPEYRGFGDIEGTITQETIGSDGIAAIEWLYSQGYKNKDIIVYGMSLGSYAATNAVYTLGQKNSFAGLILEVPFDNLPNVVREVVLFPFPLSLIIKDEYDNISKISKINTPLLIMGGSEDKTVPVNLAKNLFSQAVEPKKIIVYEGAEHNNLYDFKNYQDIINWLQTNEKTR